MNSIPNNDNWEQELDATRVKLYELTKDMTSAEQVDFFNSRGIETLKRHGVKAKVADVPIVLTTKTSQSDPVDKLPYGRGCMKGKMYIAEDFDAPLEDIQEYMGGKHGAPVRR